MPATVAAARQVPAAPGGGSVTQAFTSQTSVVVTHNLGAYPVVDVIDDALAVLIPLTITHSSVNAFTVTFTAATTGTIICTLGAISTTNLPALTKSALLALSPDAATGGRWRITDSVPAQREAFPDGTVWRYADNNKDVALDDEVTYTPGGTTQTITLNDGPTQTLLLSSASGTVTATLTIPSQPSSGRIVVRQGATPRLVTLAVSSGTLVLLGAALPLDAANTMRIYSWTYDGTRTIVGQSEVSV